MLARCRAFYDSLRRGLAAHALDLRWWLWKHIGVPLPHIDGWQALIAEVIDADGAYSSEADGVIGAPLAWSLYFPLRDGGSVRLDPIETVCAVSGVPISPTSEPFGVRCARCGVPIACTVAGMRVSTDVPSCFPCRPSVQRAIRSTRSDQ
jgi:hypothetical protein